MSRVDALLPLVVRYEIKAMGWCIQSLPVVTNLDFYTVRQMVQMDLKLCGLCMFVGVSECFLGDAKDGGTHLRSGTCAVLVTVGCLFDTFNLQVYWQTADGLEFVQ